MYFEFKCRIWEPELASVIETRENSATERRTFWSWLDFDLKVDYGFLPYKKWEEMYQSILTLSPTKRKGKNLILIKKD